MGAANRVATATIADGGSLAGAVYLGAGTLTGVQMPAAWTTAALTFQVSPDGVTYQDAYDSSGNEISLTVAAGQYIPLNPADFSGFVYFKARSGTTGSPVAQGAARSIQFQNRILGYAG